MLLLQEDDLEIQQEGLETLTEDELRQVRKALPLQHLVGLRGWPSRRGASNSVNGSVGGSRQLAAAAASFAVLPCLERMSRLLLRPMWARASRPCARASHSIPPFESRRGRPAVPAACALPSERAAPRS